MPVFLISTETLKSWYTHSVQTDNSRHNVIIGRHGLEPITFNASEEWQKETPTDEGKDATRTREQINIFRV